MKKYLLALSICAIAFFSGCIDREFDLAETSGEMTIGGEELVVPIAEIGRIAIGDLLKDNETIKPNENGVYQIAFSSFGENPDKYEKLSIDGISIPAIEMPSPSIDPVGFSFQELPTQLNLGGIERTLNVTFPTINDIVKVDPIKLQQDLALGLPGIMKGQGTLYEYMVPKDPIKSSSDSVFVFKAKLEILEQLNKVDWVQFGCEEHPHGTPFAINVQLAGIYDIVGEGSSLDLHVEFPHGYYLCDENGADLPPVDSHNIVDMHIPLNRTTLTAQDDYSVTAVVYLNRIDYSDHEFEGGVLNINDEIKYSCDLNLQLCAGGYNLNNSPKLSITADPKYKDVEVVINHFETPTLSEAISYTFNGLPSSVNVESIAFTEDTELTVSLHGLEWLKAKDNLTGDPLAPYIEIGLPKCMHFRQHDMLKDDNILIAPTTALSQGVKLSLAFIDCTSESVSIKDGALTINENITTSVHMEVLDGHTVLVSALTPPENLEVNVAISEAKLVIDPTNSKVKWNGDEPFVFDLKDQILSLSQTVNIPEMIASIEKIGICKADSQDPFSITFAFGVVDDAVFPVETLEVDVTVNLGKLLVPTAKMLENKVITQNANGDYLLVIKEDWKPNQTKLSRTIEFEALANIPGIFDGKITLSQNFPVVGSVNIKSNEDIKLSEIENAKIDVDVDIDKLAVNSFTGGVNLSVAPEPMVVELGDMGDLGVDINLLSLNPVLNVKLKENPTGIPFAANLAVKTFDSENNELRTITVPTITIAGNGASNIVLSTPRNATDYENKEGVTFVAVDNLSKLLSGGIPAKIAVDMSVATNSSDIYTVDLSKTGEGYTLEYQYEVTVPLEFDGNLDISYETVVSGLNDTFASLADQTSGLKVGDVGLIAEFGSTIPFNVVVSAELVNAEGTTEDIDARLNINECLIKGCNPKTGEKSISNVDLDFDLGDSHSLEGLKNADGIRLKFTLYGTDAESSAKLSEEQFIDAKLKLRVRDGLTVDIFDFLK